MTTELEQMKLNKLQLIDPKIQEELREKEVAAPNDNNNMDNIFQIIFERKIKLLLEKQKACTETQLKIKPGI